LNGLFRTGVASLFLGAQNEQEEDFFQY